MIDERFTRHGACEIMSVFISRYGEVARTHICIIKNIHAQTLIKRYLTFWKCGLAH